MRHAFPSSPTGPIGPSALKVALAFGKNEDAPSWATQVAELGAFRRTSRRRRNFRFFGGKFDG